MFPLLALGSAALYGAADFIGGLTSRRADTLVIVLLSQAAGLVLVALLLPALGTPAPGWPDWIWGGAAGLAGGVGVALLYRALAVGVMAVVAPITAVCAVAVPATVAVLLGERVAAQAVTGMALALVAIGLVSQPAAPHIDVPVSAEKTRGLGLALASGVAIGLFFLALARTSHDAGLWPLLAARLVSVVFFGGVVGLARRSVALPGSTLALAAGGGVLDMLANLLYLLATRLGPLSLAVTLSSLYPASTVVLARLLLGERLSRRQWLGISCALIAIVAIVSA